MIKPFKITETRTEPGGATGVLFEVWRITSESASKSVEQRMSSYMSIPAGRDADEYLFEQLSEAGWF